LFRNYHQIIVPLKQNKSPAAHPDSSSSRRARSAKREGKGTGGKPGQGKEGKGGEGGEKEIARGGKGTGMELA